MGRIGHISALVVAASALLPVVTAAAQNRTPLTTVALETATDDLRPGQYVWRDTGYAELPVSVIVSLPLQMAFVFRGDAMIGAASVSTGKRGKRTPVGDYTVLQKKVFHRSNLYSNAPMPYMQRLTWDGIALHAGQNPGYPASHGCIRLPHAFAVLLYGVTSLGVQVAVVGDDGFIAPTPAAPIVLIADIGQWHGPEYSIVTWGSGQALVSPEERREAFPRFASLVVRGDELLVPDAMLIVPDR